ncbi:MAG: hypothetical protein ISS72_09600 [Candidatus Brocadiae bacterium]|nr:hypothetical protein [Candidatus Brocadiia bacterium]
MTGSKAPSDKCGRTTRVMCSVVLWAATLAPLADAGGEVQRAEAELQALAGKVKGMAGVLLPSGAGRLVLSAEQSLTIEALRGVALDDDPPVLGKPTKPYRDAMADGCAPDQRPYVARGIQRFRFRFFHNEFSYGGHHTWPMTDYAAVHGFGIVTPYASEPADRRGHLPKGTQFLRWGGFVNWHERVPDLRYDKLAAQDVARKLRDEGVFKSQSGYGSLMIDLEHPLPGPAALREMTWYPTDASEEEQDAFEKRYYDGYAKTYTAPVQAARTAGWKNISLYGWQPFRRTFWDLEHSRVEPATDWAWNAFGKRIYDAVDILNPSVYCFYWSPRNVAYTLANIDLNLRLVRSRGKPKPVRPYYWTLLHGGGGGWRWWANQPLPDEDVRAMVALAFFAGVDGIVLWNWSGTGNHNVPQLRTWDGKAKQWRMNDVLVGEPFRCASVGGKARTPETLFRRYDALHVLSVAEDGLVRFQRIEKGNAGGKYGCTPDKPVHTMPRDKLLPHLRPPAEPVAAFIEGLALVKPLEYVLRHGDVKVDVPAQKQFGEELPIVRRVKLGRIHVMATYDPLVLHGGTPRPIVLNDFDGVRGRTLVLPADAETRLFALRDAS